MPFGSGSLWKFWGSESPVWAKRAKRLKLEVTGGATGEDGDNDYEYTDRPYERAQGFISTPYGPPDENNRHTRK